MTDAKKILVAGNKITRIKELLAIAEYSGDDENYEDLERQLEQAERKLERLQGKN